MQRKEEDNYIPMLIVDPTTAAATHNIQASQKWYIRLLKPIRYRILKLGVIRLLQPMR